MIIVNILKERNTMSSIAEPKKLLMYNQLFLQLELSSGDVGTNEIVIAQNVDNPNRNGKSDKTCTADQVRKKIFCIPSYLYELLMKHLW